MKSHNNDNSQNLFETKPISGESFFGKIRPDSTVLDIDFVPLHKSVIWHCNYLFWKHFHLWEETFHEPYEASLPTGISESHKDDFIQNSAQRFISLLERLEQQKNLPETIYVVEQGPGTGMYAKKFLDEIQKTPFYTRLQYILQDTSAEILIHAALNLGMHKEHIIPTLRDLKMYEGKILFIRHSNMWDQFPSDIFILRNAKISELLVQTIINNPSEFPRPLGEGRGEGSFQKRELEPLILKNPSLWKPFMRSLRLKTKIKNLTKKELALLPFGNLHTEIAQLTRTKQEIVVSKGVLENLSTLLRLIDFERNGYGEIVDIIAPNLSAFQKDRRPKKYDGSVATIVNGPLIKSFLHSKKKHATFTKIRGLNYMVTIQNNSLKELLTTNTFVTIGEIAAGRHQSPKDLQKQANNLYALGVDVVAFSDQAFVKPEYLTLPEVLQRKIFPHLTGGAVMPIVKTRNKTPEELEKVTSALKEQSIKNIFFVTGDPGLEKDVKYQTSLDVIPHFTKDFFVGGVTHPNITDIPKMKAKIKVGIHFFIMQATYDEKEWEKWAMEIKLLNIQEEVPIIAAIVPIVSKRTLDVLQFIEDISISEDIIRRFENLEKEEMRKEGIKLAQNLIEKYKASGLFNGIYIYSKSQQFIAEVMGF